MASDETTEQTVLEELGLDFTVLPSITVRLADKPGQVFEVSRKLGDLGVNIGCFLPVQITDGTCIVAIGVDNVEAATKALGDQVVEFTYS